MSLVDSIYEASESQEEQRSLVDTLVEKAVENSVAKRPNEFSVHQLHLRGDEIWYGYKLVEETQQNVYVLTEWEDRIPQPTLYIFWSRLKTKLPVLNLNYIQISDNLLWDKESGGIINLKEEDENQISTSKYQDGEEGVETPSEGVQAES